MCVFNIADFFYLLTELHFVHFRKTASLKQSDNFLVLFTINLTYGGVNSVHL